MQRVLITSAHRETMFNDYEITKLHVSGKFALGETPSLRPTSALILGTFLKGVKVGDGVHCSSASSSVANAGHSAGILCVNMTVLCSPGLISHVPTENLAKYLSG